MNEFKQKIESPKLPQEHLDFVQAVKDTKESVENMQNQIKEILDDNSLQTMTYVVRDYTNMKEKFREAIKVLDEWDDPDLAQQTLDKVREIIDPQPESKDPGMTFAAGGFDSAEIDDPMRIR